MNFDLEDFTLLLAEYLLPYGREVNDVVIRFWAKALAPYDLEAIRHGFEQHVNDTTEGKFPPMPAHVIAHLQDRDNRPTGEQCWECSPLTEEAGVVWTEEWKQAYFSHVYPLVAEGKAIDRARSWFLQDYERRVKEARLRREPPQWESSGSLEAVHKAIQRQQAIGMVVDSRWLNHWLERHPVLPAPERKRLARRGTELVRVVAYSPFRGDC